jgi:hypothetical protein
MLRQLLTRNTARATTIPKHDPDECECEGSAHSELNNFLHRIHQGLVHKGGIVEESDCFV